MVDITEIIAIIVQLVAAILGVTLIPYLKAKLSSIKASEDKTALDITVAWLEVAVNAAEEAARAGLIDKGCKYQYAVNFLEARGITFDEATTQALIDSKVWELFNQFKEERPDGES